MENSLLKFVETRKLAEQDKIEINEGLSDKNFLKGIDLITSILKKNVTSGKVLRLPDFKDTTVDGKECKSLIYVISSKDDNQVLAINWLNSAGSNEVYSICIFDSLDILLNKAKAKVTIYTMGASFVYFLPLIYHSLNNHDYKLNQKSLEKYAKNIVKESFRIFNVGNITYSIYEGLDDEYILEQYTEKMIDRILEKSEAQLFRNKVRDKWLDLRSKRKELAKSGKLDILKNIQDDYTAIQQALKDGAESIEDLFIEFKSNITMEILQSEKDDALEKQFNKEIEEEKEDPEVAWKEMRQYVKMVIKGINPSVIICGAPGAGKTYKIRKELKAAKYVEGQNLCTIKGKCSPRQLYLALYQFQDKGDIIMIDDADGLVGPKAPEDVINILKGALDSTSDDEGRLVSYMVAGKLLDDEGTPVPKKFYYRGGVIVITNYRAGQIDTALKGRSYVQDINFSLDDMLTIIKRIMPEMGDGKISMESKQKAFDYISSLAKDKNNDIEISMRTFGICANLYESTGDDPDFSEEDTERMIKKLLKLQAARGGKKY